MERVMGILGDREIVARWVQGVDDGQRDGSISPSPQALVGQLGV